MHVSQAHEGFLWRTYRFYLKIYAPYSRQVCKFNLAYFEIENSSLQLSGLRRILQISRAFAAGMFETKPIEEFKPGLELVTKLAKEKIDKNRKKVEERKNFGVNKALRDPYT